MSEWYRRTLSRTSTPGSLRQWLLGAFFGLQGLTCKRESPCQSTLGTHTITTSTARQTWSQIGRIVQNGLMSKQYAVKHSETITLRSTSLKGLTRNQLPSTRMHACYGGKHVHAYRCHRLYLQANIRNVGSGASNKKKIQRSASFANL